ncbi:DUF4352 domain-containing protein [bacterium]|nr:DUF4352 domain-containing protein [bacterium]
MKKIFVLMVIIILIISMGISVSACKNTISESSLFDRSKVTIQNVKQVKTGDINWNLLSVDDLGTQISNDAGAIYPATTGKFIFVSFSVENIGTDTRTLYDLKVIDDKGRIYSICNQAYGYLGPNYSACSLVDIIPDTKPQEFSATFDVNLDSKGLILEFTDLLTPPKEMAYVDLGL